MPRPADRHPPAWHPRRLDARAFAQAGAAIDGLLPVAELPRLVADLHEDIDPATVPAVAWQAHGEWREGAAGQGAAPWMHLQARAVLPLACQRCLGPVDTEVLVDRWFRFVADEAAAEAEDDDCDEDLLALDPRPDLIAVLEDELLMSLPLVPMHEHCPDPSTRSAIAADPPAPERPHPFAALAALKKPG